jgi:hypothetical protein
MSSPTYTGLSKLDLLDSAMSQPLSLTSTLWQEGKGGALESFGLGTVLRGSQVPLPAPSQDAPYGFDPNGLAVPPGISPQDYLQGTWITPEMIDKKRQEMGALTEDQYKASPSYRKDIPYDPGMTETRAAALASMDDAKKVREFYAQKRPLAAFLGSMAGQALDPINYVPVAGPAVKAAAIGRFGRIGGEALTAGLDAAANTAVFGIGTSGMRAQLGDDVSWQAIISQIATAGLIVSAFGTIHGAIGSRVDARLMSEAEQRLSTLRTTQEARIALNEGIDAVVRGEDVNLSPNSTGPLQRVADEITAYHGSPHDFGQFDVSRLGTGEGSAAYGHGLYFAENETVADFYRKKLTDLTANQQTPQGAVERALGMSGGDVNEALSSLQGNLKSVQKTIDKMGADTPPEFAARLDEYKQAIDLLQSGYKPGGNLYKVAIDANRDTLLDWDKPLSEQPEAVRMAVAKAMRMPLPRDGSAPTFEGGVEPSPTGEQIYQAIGDQAYLTPEQVSQRLSEAGIPGIKFLDQGSRTAGDGTRNFVIFSDKNVRITAKNGNAIDTSKPAPEPRPEGIKQAEASVAKPEDTKALAAQYSVDPATGAFPEEAQVAQLATEGRLTPDDAANLAQAEADYHAGSAFAEALKSVVGCLL